jgi:uncharacterized protein
VESRIGVPGRESDRPPVGPKAAANRAKGGWMCALMCALLGAGDAQADLGQDRLPVDGTIVGATSTGSLAVVVNAVIEAVRREYPGSSLAYQLSSTPGAITALGEGKALLGLAGAVDLAAAQAGQAPFKRAYSPQGFQVVARVVEGMRAYVIARGEFADRYGLVEFADVARKRPPARLSLYGPANLSVYYQALAFLGAYGIRESDIAIMGGKAVYLPTSPSIEELKDGRLDLVFAMGFHPDARLMEARTSRDIRVLAFDPPVVDDVSAKLELGTGVIAAGTYDGIDRDLYTTAMSVYIMATPATPALTTYKLARALHRHFDYFRRTHAAFAGYPAAMLARAGPYQLHDGARRYYKEANLVANLPAGQL